MSARRLGCSVARLPERTPSQYGERLGGPLEGCATVFCRTVAIKQAGRLSSPRSPIKQTQAGIAEDGAASA